MAQKQRVMIIEDDLDTIELLRVILDLKGYEPVPALGGKRGLQRLYEEGPVDLILLDLMMDDIDGWTVLKIIKEDDHLHSIPVIILSVRHQLEDLSRTRAYSDMFAGYVVKPFNVRDLMARIEAILAETKG
jgi:DNA-binding response OmpR family regulator